MLPHAHDLPTSSFQCSRRFQVPQNIARQLLLPELCIRYGLCPMERTSVPEASIDKNRKLLRSENEIGSYR